MAQLQPPPPWWHRMGADRGRVLGLAALAAAGCFDPPAARPPDVLETGATANPGGGSDAPADDTDGDHRDNGDDGSHGASSDDDTGTGGTGGASPSCAARDLSLQAPLAGEHGELWVIAAYPDTNPSDLVAEDYTGGNLTYEGLGSTAFTVANFRVMDAGLDVRAPAGGVVEFVADGFADRNLGDFGQCPAPPEQSNRVVVRHDNGMATMVSQLKRGSVAVAVGDIVSAGQVLGSVGSSGCSTRPGLLFKVLGCGYDPVAADGGHPGLDPSSEGMWEVPPVYDPPTRLHDTARRAAVFADATEAVDPGDNLTAAAAGVEFGWALYWAHSNDSAAVTLRWHRPDGTFGFDLARTLEASPRWINWGTATLSTVGRWQVDVLLERAKVGEFSVVVQ